MSKIQKIILMFLPFVFLFIGFTVYVLDVKNPSVFAQDCRVMAKGIDAIELKKDAKILYSNSGKAIHDIILDCEQNGVVLVNDFDISFTDAEGGDTAVLTHRDYKYLPDRWEMDISHPQDKPASATINQPLIPEHP